MPEKAASHVEQLPPPPTKKSASLAVPGPTWEHVTLCPRGAPRSTE